MMRYKLLICALMLFPFLGKGQAKLTTIAAKPVVNYEAELAKKASSVKSAKVLAVKVDEVVALLHTQFKGQAITVGKLFAFKAVPTDSVVNLAAALMQMRASHSKIDTSASIEQLLGIKETMVKGAERAYEEQLLLTQKYLAEAVPEEGITRFWHQKSFATDGIYGTALERAYAELLKGKTPKKIRVAVLDAGVDLEHPDLQKSLWTNSKEIAGNGIDDDHNGYIDDIHGWNFLGTKDPKVNINTSVTEGDREYYRLMQLYKGKDTTKLNTVQKKYLNQVKRVSSLYQKENNKDRIAQQLAAFDQIYTALERQKKGSYVTIAEVMDFKEDKTQPNQSLVLMSLTNIARSQNWKPADSALALINSLKNNLVINAKKGYADQLAASAIDYRKEIYAGLPEKNKAKYYGNNVLSFSSADHGTAVNGIIGADRDNRLGAMGMVDDVELMNVRVVLPMGDEYDEDVANGIRYAVDNGAQIINLSFGKNISPNKKIVDAAVKYAEKKGVLIVRGAGNNTKNTDVYPFYPTQFYENGKEAKNMITVGATDLKGRIMGFSNYGKHSLDLFAPGFNIYSSITRTSGGYERLHGTSMASPIVAGTAALIMSYYPNLTAIQVKDILMKTVTKVAPGNAKPGMELSDISISGGILNAYDALKMAATYPLK
ncbi:S8 family serine peptidase [Pedobacter sp. MC2016-14]|uniref:S8 family serine peptidase n=1 Tax=Pedobacter sp. MC2016-14 TaxID=2897327 RepID=UPI001E3479DE|nr:S8 family serine peptidase [Pedobacter sp. MC2016-14]MCD0488608.1 S8 family serine peptidase [Pedobacter sp. MC2016-14]